MGQQSRRGQALACTVPHLMEGRQIMQGYGENLLTKLFKDGMLADVKTENCLKIVVRADIGRVMLYPATK